MNLNSLFMSNELEMQLLLFMSNELEFIVYE